MIAYECIVQEGAIPPAIRLDLVVGLARISAALLGGSPDAVEVTFTDIPKGWGFRGGELSTTSLVRGQLSAACEQSVRVQLFQQICDMWCEIAGCTTDELVVSARDPRPAHS